MSAEQNASGPSTTSASTYPSTSLPPASSTDPPENTTTNGAQAENGTHPPNPIAGFSPSDSQTDTLGSTDTPIPAISTTLYSSKLTNSNGQTRSHPVLSNHNSNPSPSEQPPTNFVDNPASNSTPPQQLNSDHPVDFLPVANQNDGFVHTNEPPSTNLTPPNVYKAQITTSSLKPSKNVNGGDKTPTNDQIEPSTSSTTSATNAKTTPKASQSKSRTPARNRQKAAGGETKTPRSGAQNATSNASGQAGQTAGTKRPHPNQYTYQTAPKDTRAGPYPPRYNNSVTVPAGSAPVHHGGQQVQYSIPASNSYSSPKIYVQSQNPSTVSSPYTLHPRPGAASLSQRTSVPAGSSSPQLIIQCRPDQQPYSQGQTSNQHFIIQTQQASDQPPTVYQPRPGVSGRPEIQRQYIQTIPNGPPTQTSVSTSQGQQTGGQQVLHIQLHHSDMPGQQKVLIQQPSGNPTGLSTFGQMPNGPQQQAISNDSQHLSNLADRQGPSSSSALVHQHHLPSTAQQQLQRKNTGVRTLPAQPPMAIKSEEIFDEMHPAHLPLPDSFNTILDQIHASGESPKTFYRRLKKQFKYLVYENECYQEELRNSQRHLLKLSRDKNFLLDRLLNYESAEEVSEDSDADSDATIEEKPKPKKKKVQPPRKRNPAPSTSKKASAKTTPKPEDENSQCSVDSALASNSQLADSQTAINNFATTGENKP